MINEEEPSEDSDVIEFTFIFALIWSLGGCLKPESRKKFEDTLKKISGRVINSPSTMYDLFYDYKDLK